MADKENIRVEVWDDDGFIELTAEEKRSIATTIPVEIEEITDKVEAKQTEAPEEPYIKKGNKKLYKTKTKYVYKVADKQYEYRLYLKKNGHNIDRFFDCHPETKEPLRSERSAKEALTIHKYIISKDVTFVNEKVTFGQVW